MGIFAITGPASIICARILAMGLTITWTGWSFRILLGHRSMQGMKLPDGTVGYVRILWYISGLFIILMMEWRVDQAAQLWGLVDLSRDDLLSNQFTCT